VVDGFIEELTNASVEFLETVEVHREHVFTLNARERRVQKPMIGDVPSQVLLDEDDGVHDLVQGDSLVEAALAPLLELRPHAKVPGVAYPVSQLVENLEKPLFEGVLRHCTKSPRPFIGHQVSGRIAREVRRLAFDELDELDGDHE
jgi:hypothetical protein